MTRTQKLQKYVTVWILFVLRDFATRASQRPSVLVEVSEKGLRMKAYHFMYPDSRKSEPKTASFDRKKKDKIMNTQLECNFA